MTRARILAVAGALALAGGTVIFPGALPPGIERSAEKGQHGSTILLIPDRGRTPEWIGERSLACGRHVAFSGVSYFSAQARCSAKI